ncbi:MAG: DinB family protein [Phycisphaerae bacterium]
MKPYVIQTTRFVAGYAKMMLADVADADMTQPAGQIVNHPAWQLGHIVYGLTNATAMLKGQEPDMPAWATACGMGSSPEACVTTMPGKAELLAGYEAAAEAFAAALAETDDATLAAPNPAEDLRAMMPTLGDMVTFLATAHAAVHLGQASAWRRARGGKPLF